MKKYYHSTNFDFSPKARQWILEQYKDIFETSIGHDVDFNLYNKDSQIKWHNSLVGIELTQYLSQFNCDTKFYGIGTFVCNLGDPLPHIDTKLDSAGKLHRIKSRFNVMILGNSTDPLTWWNVDYDDIGTTMFVGPDGNQYPTKHVINLPNESFTARNVYTPSAFVKTDCPHTVNFTPGPRLIVTVALDKTIEEILNSSRVDNI